MFLAEYSDNSNRSTKSKHGGHFLSLLKTKNRFSATSLDQLPHHLVSYLLYGHQLLIPISDIDHTDFFLIIGANPLASNGSLMTVPNVRKRVQALQKRGGKLVVIDPRRSETGKIADEHHFIRPGSDASFLLALLRTLFEEDLVTTNHVTPYLKNLDRVRSMVAPFTPETDEVMKGVVSLPHGWGHNRSGVRLSVATRYAGASMNDLTDEKVFDPISGNASLNAIPATITAVPG